MISNTSIHAGIRCKLEVIYLPHGAIKCACSHILFQGPGDLQNDQAVGFQLISSDDIDDLGIPEVIRRIRNRIGDSPVYLRYVPDLMMPVFSPDAPSSPQSLDIDVIGSLISFLVI